MKDKSLPFTSLLMLFLFTSLAVAGQPMDTKKSMTEGDYCVECDMPLTPADPNMEKSARDSLSIRKTLLGMKPAQRAAEAISDLESNGSCNEFITESGYGPLGEVILKNFQSGEYDVLLEGTHDLAVHCPGYRRMNRDQKMGLMVAVITGIAFHESSCETNPKPHRGPNGFLVGLFQLHKGKEHLYSDECSKKAGSQAEKSVVCAMSMMQKQIQEEQSIFSQNSYWEVLRPKARGHKADSIKKVIRNYPLCY